MLVNKTVNLKIGNEYNMMYLYVKLTQLVNYNDYTNIGNRYNKLLNMPKAMHDKLSKYNII